MWRDDAYLLDMLLYAKKATDFCTDISLETFVADEKLQMATLYAIQVIGEAASKISTEFQKPIRKFHGLASSTCATGLFTIIRESKCRAFGM